MVVRADMGPAVGLGTVVYFAWLMHRNFAAVHPQLRAETACFFQIKTKHKANLSSF